jgi:hypothetical protein
MAATQGFAKFVSSPYYFTEVSVYLKYGYLTPRTQRTTTILSSLFLRIHTLINRKRYIKFNLLFHTEIPTSVYFGVFKTCIAAAQLLSICQSHSSTAPLRDSRSISTLLSIEPGRSQLPLIQQFNIQFQEEDGNELGYRNPGHPIPRTHPDASHLTAYSRPLSLSSLPPWS